jgi:hypothetical protein
LFQELQTQLSFRIDEASKVLKNTPQMLLDAVVDSTFKFSDQTLHPSEVLQSRKLLHTTAISHVAILESTIKKKNSALSHASFLAKLTTTCDKFAEQLCTG